MKVNEQENGQDDEVGRCRAPLFSQAHQNTAICRTTINDRDLKSSRKKSLTTKDRKREPQRDE